MYVYITILQLALIILTLSRMYIQQMSTHSLSERQLPVQLGAPIMCDVMKMLHATFDDCTIMYEVRSE